jgi:ribosomal protein S18 acetylase RimI-like enzyme
VEERRRVDADETHAVGAASVVSVVAPEALEAARTLALALRDNPLNRAVIGDDSSRRLRSNFAGMRTSLEGSVGLGAILGIRDDARGFSGALVGAAPYQYPFPRSSLGSQVRCFLAQGLAVQRRWSKVYRTMLPLHPPHPHWYLSVIGVEPALRGRGLGRALLRAWLSRVDAERGAGYLETDREENIGFYSREGFEVCRELSVLGVRVWCMNRPPVDGPAD